jgi:hypothetical protein
MTKEYTIQDLFFTRWEDLAPRIHSEVFTLYQGLDIPKDIPGGGTQYGFSLIQILRRIRKNPDLVNKINVEQAVDIFNDLKFLREPWYFFPKLPNRILPMVRPDEKMARHTFDHFIYADNEFSLYLITHEEKYLRRLVVTLYPLIGEEIFDPEEVDYREKKLLLAGKLKPWQYNLVFFTFAQIREHIMQRCKTLLPAPMKKRTIEGEDISESLEEITAKAQPTGAMWYKIKHQVARTPVFGGFEGTGRANMYHVLDHLEILCKEQQPHGKS